MGDPSKSFSWRDYVKISEEFTPEQRGLIEQSFDRMAQFHDGEGKTLIKAAAARAGGPVHVFAGEMNKGDLGRMTLNFDELGTGIYTNDPHGRGPSILGTMVHEMYHMADPNADRELAAAEREMATVVRADGSRHVIPGFSEVLPDQNDIFYRLRRGTDANRTEIAEYLEKNYPDSAPLQEYAAMVRTTTPEQWKQRFQEAGVTDAGGTLLSETRATEYTDAIMAKNVGNAEPQRGHYTATEDASKPYALDNIPTVLPTAQPTKGFDGPGDVDVAPVAADPMAKSIDGIDLSALRHCRTDGQHYCNGTTGQLVTSVQNDKAVTKDASVGM